MSQWGQGPGTVIPELACTLEASGRFLKALTPQGPPPGFTGSRCGLLSSIFKSSQTMLTAKFENCWPSM